MKAKTPSIFPKLRTLEKNKKSTEKKDPRVKKDAVTKQFPSLIILLSHSWDY